MNHWEKLALLVALIFVICVCAGGCVSMPAWVAESTEVQLGGNILITSDYVELVIERYTGEERRNKLLIVEKHLKLSKELNDYCQEHKDE